MATVETTKAGLDISEVRIRLIDQPNGTVLGWASCLVNGVLFLNNIAIVRGEESIHLRYPFQRAAGSQQKHHHHNPITKDAQEAFDRAILGRLAEMGLS